MSKDLYGKPRGFQSPIGLILLTICGLIVLFFLIDWGFDIYYQIQVDKDTKAALESTMKTSGLVKTEDYMDTFYQHLNNRDRYNKDTLDIRYNEEDGSVIVINYVNYWGFFENVLKLIPALKAQRTVKYASYKAYYNKYKEIVIEKYDLLKEMDELEKAENRKLEEA